MNVLEVKNLASHFFTREGVVKAVDGVSFSLGAGESLGLVGESGCGKSMLALSLLRLLDSPGKIVSGEMLLANPAGNEQVDLLKLSTSAMRAVRGRRIAMIFQEPMTSLNPVYTIGDQIIEAVSLHEHLSKREMKKKAIEMLKLVGIPAAEKRVDDYPHQLSGGMRQRVMISIALSCKPDILIADEPTTALDVTIQAQILELILELKEKLGMALILISHDLGVIAEVAERVLIMYAGKIVEEGKTSEIFDRPLHPYTQGLMNTLPERADLRHKGHLPTIPGHVPSLIHLPLGCSFQERCAYVQTDCRQQPIPDDPCHTGRLVRCLHVPGI
ncbi:MAG: peptide ABC transporter ATP-binding protein [Deltaproteobacteria bacterium CG_4_10_14_0_2_um_filter_43_8]|nr:MAG: peptide ABC transporter ATP-binding protein [Deltaproteobacteria bacterium CG11_big_fil_rev_8_21_14_0_20_42_23]PJA19962.1 MAG: peptide ABC transporter ATP-binding protein [Deltaproteobacteria bacterium CG_4_10_14_0_2_um_filter_43_8]PJC63614.1 MAG: peptide ABC transporter ATP-binding protein [Deltaproteobacteria bacterium CG_4_9_14_0_2_um_filter_42_21]